jgi:hypothetical protein
LGTIRLGDAGVLSALGPERAAVLRLEVLSVVEGRELGDLCTGVRIAPGAVLTAKHCFLPEGARKLRVSETDAAPADGACADEQGEEQPSQEWRKEGWRVASHPSRDVALVLSDDPSRDPGVPLAASLPGEGEKALLAGYGLQEDGQKGAFRSVAASVLSATVDQISIQVENGGGCNGDSGGPLFARTATGAAALWGVLISGSASCLGTDQVVPVAALESWLANLTTPTWTGRDAAGP